MAGEDAHDTGEDGLQRAKDWLELSTRVHESWTRHDRAMSELLEFTWPYPASDGQKARPFSYDLGGVFRGDSLDNQSFVAEIKKYKAELDLPKLYRDFLAKCYAALQQKPNRCDHFLWISWAPFRAGQWDQHTTSDNVRASILHMENRRRTTGVDDEVEAAAKLSPELLVGVASRIWLVTLSEKQEQLVLTGRHYLEVVKLITAEGRVGV